MNNLITEKRITLEEAAEILGYDESTLRKIGKELFPDSFRNGIKTCLNENEITIIKLHLGKNSELPKTNLEKQLIIYQAFQFLNEQIEDLKKKAAEDAPKVEFFDTVTNSKDAVNMAHVAKVLDCGIGRNRLFEFLRNQSVLTNDNTPFQKYIDMGYFRVIMHKYNDKTGSPHIFFQTIVYPTGMSFIHTLLKRNGVITQKAS